MKLLIKPYFIPETVPGSVLDPRLPVSKLITLQHIFPGHERLHLFSAFRQDLIEPIINMYAEFIRHRKVRYGIE